MGLNGLNEVNKVNGVNRMKCDKVRVLILFCLMS